MISLLAAKLYRCHENYRRYLDIILYNVIKGETTTTTTPTTTTTKTTTTTTTTPTTTNTTEIFGGNM